MPIENRILTYAGPERRQYKRIRKHFIANFKEKNLSAWDMVTMRNLGAGGALFNYDRKLRLNTLLDLKIIFPASRNPINCSGRIIRIEEPESLPVYGIAVSFEEIES